MGKYLDMIEQDGLEVMREEVPAGTLFAAYVPDRGRHSFTRDVGGRRMGMVGTQALPDGVVSGPMAGESWRGLQATVAHREILRRHPELCGADVSVLGPALVVRREGGE